VGSPGVALTGIDRTNRITKSLLDRLGLLGPGYSGVPARVLPSTPSSPGRTRLAPTPSWALVGTAAQLAMAQHAQAHIVKVDAAHVSMSPTRSGDSPDRRRCPQHQLKGQQSSWWPSPERSQPDECATAIVLVHGAWADGYRVTAPQFPMTRLADDVARLRQVLSRQNGPTLSQPETSPSINRLSEDVEGSA
jgi:hypothetical protein